MNIKTKQQALDHIEDRIIYWLDENKFGRVRILENIKKQVEEDKWEGQYKYIGQVGLDYKMPEWKMLII
jgi:hypothetical protein